MRFSVRLAYVFLQLMLRLYGAMFWDLRVLRNGASIRGRKIYVVNHVTSTDPYWLIAAFPEFLHMVAGPPYNIPMLGRLLPLFEQINALPQYRKTVVAEARRYLEAEETICIFPEGDVQPPFTPGHFYAGPAKIYRQSGAPIIPVAIAVSPASIRRHPRWDIHMDGQVFEARMVWRGKVRIAIGEPMYPRLDPTIAEEQDNRRITDDVRSQIEQMLRKLRSQFPECTSLRGESREPSGAPAPFP